MTRPSRAMPPGVGYNAADYREGIMDACMGWTNRQRVPSTAYDAGQKVGERYCVRRRVVRGSNQRDVGGSIPPVSPQAC